jgi:hypothetical protein
MTKKQTSISIIELASLCHLTPRRLYQLAADDVLPRPIKGKMPCADALQRLFSWFAREPEGLRKEKLLTMVATRKTRELEFDVAEKSLINRAVATATIIGTMKRYHAFVRAEIEVHTPAARRDKLLELGVRPDVVAQFHAFDSKASMATTDRIEDRCEREAKQITIPNENENQSA